MMMMTQNMQAGYLSDKFDGPGSIPGNARLSLLHSVQTGSGDHAASYPMGTQASSPGGKAAGAST
jgi:hypothetical protein